MFDHDAKKEDATGREKAGPRFASGGVTDVFSTVSSPATGADPETSSAKAPTEEEAVPAPSEPVRTRPVAPVVHEIVFGQGSASRDGSEALRNLLHSSPPPRPPAGASSLVPAPVDAMPDALTPPQDNPNSGFTQLLRALNFDQTSVKPAKAPEPVPGPAAPAGAAPVTNPSSAATQGDPTASGESSPSAVADQSGSFTRLFRALETPKQANPEEQLSKATLPPLASEESVTAQGFAGESPGSFTHLFQTLKTPAVAASAEDLHDASQSPVAARPASEQSDAGTPGSFTQLFTTPDRPSRAPEQGSMWGTASSAADASGPKEPANMEPNPAHMPAAPGPGSFTQMFQALDAPAATLPRGAEPRERAGLPLSQPEPVASSSLSQLFHSLDAPEQSHDAQAVQEHAKAGGADPESGPGAFTRMFNTLPATQQSPVAAATPVPSMPLPAATAPTVSSASSQAGPGSFTQIFKMLDATPEESVHAREAPRESVFPPEPSRVPDAGKGSGPAFMGPESALDASQVFSSYAPAPEAKRTSAQDIPSSAGSFQPPAQRSSPGPAAAPEGLTQLLRTLDQGLPPSKAPGSPYESPVAPRSQPSTFTSAYEALGAAQPFDSTAANPAPPAAAAAVHPTPAEAIRAVPAAVIPPAFIPAGVIPAVAPSPTGVPTAMPSPAAAPGFPGPSEFTRLVTASALREAGLRPGGAGAGAAELPQALKAPLSAASVPTLPAAKLEAPAGGKMQQLLPVLLILIIILLVAILVTVVILMKK